MPLWSTRSWIGHENMQNYSRYALQFSHQGCLKAVTKINLHKHSKRCPVLWILKYVQKSSSAICSEYCLLLCKVLTLHCSALSDSSFLSSLWVLPFSSSQHVQPLPSWNFLPTSPLNPVPSNQETSLDIALVPQATLTFYLTSSQPHLPTFTKLTLSQLLIRDFIV